MRFIIIIVIWLTIFVAKAQDQPNYSEILRGSWIVPESVIRTEIESPSHTSYFRYVFQPEGAVYFASHEYEIGTSSPYRIEGSKVQMFGHTYHIIKFTGDQITLTTNNPFQKQPHIISLMRQDVYDSLHRAADGLGRREKWPAVFHGNVHLHSFLFSTATSLIKYRRGLEFGDRDPDPPLPYADRFIKLHFTVDVEGNVKVMDVSGAPDMSARKEQILREKLEDTSGEWIPARYRGAKVIDTLDLVFVQRGKSSVAFRSKVHSLQQSAEDYFRREKFELALLTITKAINLDPHNYAFYVLRANCYFMLNQHNRYCEDRAKAHTLNRALGRETIKVINGEMVNIECP